MAVPGSEIEELVPGTEPEAPHLSDSEIKDIIAAVRRQDSDTVNAILRDLSPVDAAELIAKITDEDRHELLIMYAESINPVTFAEMEPELRRMALQDMTPSQVAEIITKLESDDALALISTLEEDFQRQIIQKLSARLRLTLEEGLSFPEESAGRLMQREVVAVPEFWNVGKTIDYLRSASSELPEDFFDVFVVSPTYRIIGEIPLGRLVRAPRGTALIDLCRQDLRTIPAEMDQEEVAHIFRRDNLVSAPVVDENGRLLGVITIDDIIDVIDKEAQEDILHLAGVDQGDLYRAALDTSGTRFRWLFINLITAVVASVVISFFDATIEEIVALAILMPIVASMGGNAGTQALTVVVRGLATRELSQTNTWRVIWKETLVGVLNGSLFAVLCGFLAALWFSNPLLGVVIACAMLINLVAAGFCGASIPIVLNKMGSDPALSSTVLLTTVTDVVGFLAFLGLAAALLAH